MELDHENRDGGRCKPRGCDDVEGRLVRIAVLLPMDILRANGVPDCGLTLDLEVIRLRILQPGWGSVGVTEHNFGVASGGQCRIVDRRSGPSGHARQSKGRSVRLRTVLVAVVADCAVDDRLATCGPTGDAPGDVSPVRWNVVGQTEFRCDGLGLPVRNDDFGRRILRRRKPRRQRSWCCRRSLWARLGRFGDRDPLVSAGRFRCQFGYSPQH